MIKMFILVHILIILPCQVLHQSRNLAVRISASKEIYNWRELGDDIYGKHSWTYGTLLDFSGLDLDIWLIIKA